MIWIQEPEVGSQSRMAPSHPLLASLLPSGLHPTPYTRQMKGLPSRFPYAHFPPLAASGPVLPAAADGDRPDSIEGLGKDALTHKCPGKGCVLQLDALQIRADNGEPTHRPGLLASGRCSSAALASPGQRHNRARCRSISSRALSFLHDSPGRTHTTSALFCLYDSRFFFCGRRASSSRFPVFSHVLVV